MGDMRRRWMSSSLDDHGHLEISPLRKQRARTDYHPQLEMMKRTWTLSTSTSSSSSSLPSAHPGPNDHAFLTVTIPYSQDLGLIVLGITSCSVMGTMGLLWKYRHKIRRGIINIIGSILSDILEHPQVDTALSKTIAKGVNRWMANPETHQTINHVIQVTPRHVVAKELGKETPGYVLKFAEGVWTAITHKQQPQEVQVSTTVEIGAANKDDNKDKKTVLEKKKEKKEGKGSSTDQKENGQDMIDSYRLERASDGNEAHWLGVKRE